MLMIPQLDYNFLLKPSPRLPFLTRNVIVCKLHTSNSRGSHSSCVQTELHWKTSSSRQDTPNLSGQQRLYNLEGNTSQHCSDNILTSSLKLGNSSKL